MTNKRWPKDRPPTAKQRDLLAFCAEFFADNDQLPPAHVIADRFGWASENAAFEMMVALERRGFIQRNAVGKWRFARSNITEAV